MGSRIRAPLSTNLSRFSGSCDTCSVVIRFLVLRSCWVCFAGIVP